MLAVDIALVPPKPMADLAVELSKQLDSEILLGPDCLPHITLAMGCIAEEQLGMVQERMQELAERFGPVPVTAEHVKSSEFSGKVSSVIEVAKDEELMALHNAVMDAIAPLFSYDASPEMFVQPLRELSAYWKADGPRKYVRDQYRPHITLGRGAIDSGQLPMSGECVTLMLCHLGKGSTCRRVLFSTELRPKPYK